MHIPRLRAALERWGERFERRVFTGDERSLCGSRADPGAAFALRFAAKEAFSKALGLGMRQGVCWKDIEVFHESGGRPRLRVKGRSREICLERGIVSMHLSLSDEGDYGIATVILEART